MTTSEPFARGLAGYAWFQPPDSVHFDVRDDLPVDAPLATQMLAWAASRRLEFAPGYPWLIDIESMEQCAQALLDAPPAATEGHRYLTATALESDAERVGLLERNGLVRTRHHAPFLSRSLAEPVTVPALAAGLRLGHVEAAGAARA